MDPNLDPQLFQLMDIPFPIKAEPDEAQTGIATAVPDVSSWPHGDCWKSSRPIEPTFWAYVPTLTCQIRLTHVYRICLLLANMISVPTPSFATAPSTPKPPGQPSMLFL